jgi:hypothetical protein
VRNIEVPDTSPRNVARLVEAMRYDALKHAPSMPGRLFRQEVADVLEALSQEIEALKKENQ